MVERPEIPKISVHFRRCSRFLEKYARRLGSIALRDGVRLPSRLILSNLRNRTFSSNLAHSAKPIPNPFSGRTPKLDGAIQRYRCDDLTRSNHRLSTPGATECITLNQK